MSRENKCKRILYGVILLLVICLTGCGGKEEKDTQSQQPSTETETEQLYMITENDTLEEFLALRSLENGLETCYDYGFSTRFLDKYGTYTTASQFTPGRIVSIGDVDKEGYLTEVQVSDQVWEQKKVKYFSIDEEKGIFTIADTKYSIQDKVFIFSNGMQVPFTFISEDDVLTVTGMDKKILSIVVTTGHGTLALSNTELFVDSFLQLNQNIFAMITGDMDMELQEGTYTLKVANDGWGGTTEIEIQRGETTVVDLDTLKGEGKKKGLISFDIDVEDVEVYVDYELVDHTQAVELTYGTHVLEIEADGYSTWKKYLFVNSKEATLVIELEALEEESEASEESEETEEPEASEEPEETKASETSEVSEETEEPEVSEEPEETEEPEVSEEPEETEEPEVSEAPEETEESEASEEPEETEEPEVSEEAEHTETMEVTEGTESTEENW